MGKSLMAAVSSALVPKRAGTLSSVDGRGGWHRILESFPGAWQQNVEISVDCVLAYHAVYACITLIANDIGKLPQRLMALEESGVWKEVTSSAFSPVLRRPNRFQNHIQFKQWWITSKLIRGNAYALKVRDGRGVVIALYLLDPCRVTPLVAPDGSIYYQLNADNLVGLKDAGITVPASEIIHDRMNCLFHPLVGISPLFAAGTAANIGLNIERNSTHFFGNSSQPGGILVAPGAISQATADELKLYWNANFTGANAGKVAVVGDGLKFEQLRMSAVDSQLIEQLKWTADVVCSCFHVPPFKIGIGTMPTFQNGQLANQGYYDSCLQILIEEYEACMDEGLGLEKPVDGRQMGVELDLDALLRMDSATQADVLTKEVAGSLRMINEARKKMGLPPVAGGDVIWSQQQNWPISELAKRPAEALVKPPAPAPVADPEVEDEPTEDEQVARFVAALQKNLEAA